MDILQPPILHPNKKGYFKLRHINFKEKPRDFFQFNSVFEFLMRHRLGMKLDNAQSGTLPFLVVDKIPSSVEETKNGYQRNLKWIIDKER